MNLAELSKLQISADERRGFPVQFNSDHQKIEQITKDLVGLMGEVGEFANLIKKVDLKENNPKYEGPSLGDARYELKYELADILIYLMRLAAIVDIDLEEALVDKMKFNKDRYASLERESK